MDNPLYLLVLFLLCACVSMTGGDGSFEQAGRMLYVVFILNSYITSDINLRFNGHYFDKIYHL